MTTTTQTAIRIHAVPPATLAQVRANRLDTSGNPVVQMRADGGEPLRCCLRDAAAGEQLLLFGYQPPLPASPYREVGAIFTHADPCAGPDETSTYPAAWRGRPQVLRAYDRRGWIRDSTVHDGRHPEAAIEAALSDPHVVQVHSRNVAYGCFMFAITRAV